MVSLEVNSLAFDFDERWVAVKWDDHLAWRRSKLNGHDGTKAIDILALRDDDQLWLIEASDIRGERRRITNRNTRSDRDEPTALEFSRKVRDTLAATTWAQGRMPEAEPIVRYIKKAWRGQQGKVNAVLWLEGIDEGLALPLEDEATQHLRWLGPKIRVTNNAISNRQPRHRIEGLTVRAIARP